MERPWRPARQALAPESTNLRNEADGSRVSPPSPSTGALMARHVPSLHSGEGRVGSEEGAGGMRKTCETKPIWRLRLIAAIPFSPWGSGSTAPAAVVAPFSFGDGWRTAGAPG
jgi:hypothetical protein